MFTRHGEWITGFVINGEKHGGDYVPREDPRVLRFIDWVNARGRHPESVLECGCLEGGHTLSLAGAWPQAAIHALDARTQNLDKARAVCDALGAQNVTFVADDLDNPKHAFARSYDAIFCVGLLYHLSDPQQFLKRACAASPLLWLWTVYCSEEEAATLDQARRGRMLPEHTDHPLAAVSQDSYLPTLGKLMDYLWEAGYSDIWLVRKEMTSNGNGPAITLAASR